MSARRELSFPQCTPTQDGTAATNKLIEKLDTSSLVKNLTKKVGEFRGEGSKEAIEEAFDYLLECLQMILFVALPGFAEAIEKLLELPTARDVPVDTDPVDRELNRLVYILLWNVVGGNAYRHISKYGGKIRDGQRAVLKLASVYKMMDDMDALTVRERIWKIKIDGSKDPAGQLLQLNELANSMDRLTGTYGDVLRKTDLLGAIKGSKFYVHLVSDLAGTEYTSQQLEDRIGKWYETHKDFREVPSSYAAPAVATDAEYEAAALLVYSRGEGAFNKRRDGYALAAYHTSGKTGPCFSCGKEGHRQHACPTKDLCIICADGSQHENSKCPIVVQMLAARKDAAAVAVLGAGRGRGRCISQEAKALVTIGAKAEAAAMVDVPKTYAAAATDAATETAASARQVSDTDVVKRVIGRRDYEIAC